MSSTLTIARPYARAAFELAQAHNVLGEWAGKLSFAAQVAADPQVSGLFGNPHIGDDALASLFLPDHEAVDGLFARFVQMLAENARLRELPEITALYEQYKLDSERVLKVRVRTAAPIDAEEAAKIKEALQRRFNCGIELEQSLDPQILGGAIIDAGDVVIDGSVRGRLARLQNALMH